ncbi:MAG: hypothetical protein RMK21_05310 [Aquificaceae bacterium]|nr:hypothetical protein [Aquificaceae bacterium]
MSPELFIALLGVALILFLALHTFVRERLDFYRSMGAEVKGLSWLIHPKAEIAVDGLSVELCTSGLRGMQRLKLSLFVGIVGYISLRKKDFLDRLLLHKTHDGLLLEYEEEAWASRILKHSGFSRLKERLFSEAQVDFVELKAQKLTAGWFIKRSPKEVGKEKVTKALSIFRDSPALLEGLPSSSHYREGLREWLTIRTPLLTTLLLSLLGVLLGFYRYQPICMVELFLAGYKWLFLPFLLYATLVLFMLGSGTMWRGVTVRLFFFYAVGSPLIALFFLTYINGRFDPSKPELRRDRIESVSVSFKRGPRVRLEEFHHERWWCEGFDVSEDFYKRAYKGAEVEYEKKGGLLGVEWFYRGLRLVE